MHHARSDDAAIRIARRALGTFVLAGTTAVVWFAFVNPAGAHTPTVKATCVRGQAVLVVELRNYSDRVANIVGVEDGVMRLEAKKFTRSYQGTWARPGDIAHDFKVVVRASDDVNGDRGFSFTKTVHLPACAQPETKLPLLPVFTKLPILAPVPTTTTPHTTEPSTSTTGPTTTTPTPSSSQPLLPPILPPAGDKDEADKEKAEKAKAEKAKAKAKQAEKAKEEKGKESTSTGSATLPTSETSTSPSSETATTATPTSRTTPSFPVGTSTSKAAIVAVGNGGNLPNTGASIAIPLLFGLCLVTAGGVVIFSMRTPRKRGRHAA